MNKRQERFVREYLVDTNATKAAIRAGYSQATAHAIGHKLLKVAEVADAIAKGNKKLLDLADITAQDIVREFARIATLNLAEVFDSQGKIRPLHTLSEDQQRALVSVEAVRGGRGRPGGVIKVRAHDKVAALTQLGRIRGMFVDKVEQVNAKPITLLMVDRTAPDEPDLTHSAEQASGG